MTDYYVRPVYGSDSNGGTGPDNAWKTFFRRPAGNAGGTYNNAQVTDGDTVFLWAEGVTAGEFPESSDIGTQFTWYFPLMNGNISLIGVNANGIEDGTRYTYYMTDGYAGDWTLQNTSGNAYSWAYPELTGLGYAGSNKYSYTMKNLRFTETKTLDSSKASSYGSLVLGEYSSALPVMINCESGPHTGGVGHKLPWHEKYNGRVALIDCYFHDIAGAGAPKTTDPMIIGCLFDNVNATMNVGLYGRMGGICNNVFINGSGNGVMILDNSNGNQNSFKQISNNVFYNNDGYCIKTTDDVSLSGLFLYNNVFDSNETAIDLNSITHTYSSLGGAKNVFRNNTNNIINSGSATIQDFLTTGFGAGGSGGVGTTLGSTENYFTGNIYYSSITGTGDFRVKTTGSLDQLGYLNQTVGIGLAPFSQTASGSLSLGTGGLGDVIDVTGRSFQRTEISPNVWRRYNSAVADASAGNFVPSDISGLVAWWDPSDSSTITLSGSGVTADVTAIANKVNGGKSLVTYGNSPHIATASLNRKDVLSFVADDGLHTNGVLTDANAVTMFFVYDAQNDTQAVMFNSGNNQFVSTFQETSSNNMIDHESGTPQYHVDGAFVGITGGYQNTTITRGGWHELISDGTGWHIIGGVGSNFSAWASGDFIVFNYNTWETSGLLADLIVYSSNLSTSDRQKVEGYLAHKWDLTAKLPSNHPYKIYGP